MFANQKQLTIDMVPQDFEVAIRYSAGQWVVEKPQELARRLPDDLQPIAGAHPEWPNKERHDTVTWKLDPDGPDASVYFQFPPRLFLNVPNSGDTSLSKDMTAAIDGRGGTLTLELDVSADRRTQPYYYAVWIQPRDPKFGTGAYAVGLPGRNPPPEINIGP
jgi:hypothetical protein